MEDEQLLALATQIVAAKITAHAWPPGSPELDDWAEEQLLEWWGRLRRVRREGGNTGTVRPFPGES